MPEDFLPQDKELLQKLEELIRFGSNKLNTVKIDFKTIQPRLFLLFSMTGAVHNYTEAIYLLAKDARKEAGIVLLRCIIETVINCEYILNDETGKRAAAFIADDETDRKKLMTRLTDFLNKHPEYKADFQERSDEERQKYVEDREKEVETMRQKLGDKLVLPNLSDRAKLVDRSTGKPEQEYNYLTVYWYFSHLAHLTSRGLDNFLSVSPDGKKVVFTLAQNFNGLSMLFISTYVSYLAFLGTMSKHFGIPTDEELKPFEEYFRRITGLSK